MVLFLSAILIAVLCYCLYGIGKCDGELTGYSEGLDDMQSSMEAIDKAKASDQRLVAESELKILTDAVAELRSEVNEQWGYSNQLSEKIEGLK